jgi:hypothetical protein
MSYGENALDKGFSRPARQVGSCPLKAKRIRFYGWKGGKRPEDNPARG